MDEETGWGDFIFGLAVSWSYYGKNYFKTRKQRGIPCPKSSLFCPSMHHSMLIEVFEVCQTRKADLQASPT
jgi:hypothetical protein